MKKILFIFLMTLMSVMVSISSAMAVSYEYTGNKFTTADGFWHTTDDSVSATLSFNNWLPANYSGDVSGFSGFGLIMNAGTETYDSDWQDMAVFSADISTNESGQIITWDLGMDDSTFDYFWIVSRNQPGVSVTDYTGSWSYGSGSVTNNPGSWSSPVVPEPVSSTLFIIGGATLVFRRWRG